MTDENQQQQKPELDDDAFTRALDRYLAKQPPAQQPPAQQPPTAPTHAPAAPSFDVNAQIRAALQDHDKETRREQRINDLEKQVGELKGQKPRKRAFFSPLFGD